MVDVPLIENSECEEWHRRKGITVRLYGEMLCAGYKFGGKDSCKVGQKIIIPGPPVSLYAF